MKYEINYYAKDNNLIKENVELIEIETNKRKNSYNNVKYMQFNNKKGYLKCSDSSSPTLDKFEFIICQLGKLLKINMAQTYLVKNNNKIIGIISEDVLKNGEKLEDINSCEFKSNIDMNNPEIINLINSIKKITGVNHKGSPVLDEEKLIPYMIELFPNVIKTITNDKINKICEDYYKMIILDLITGNLDRNRNNYAIIKDKESNYRFSPLFDNATISMPDMPSYLRNINGYLIDEKDIFMYMYQNHNDILKPILDKIKEVEKIKEFLDNITLDILDDSEKEWLYSRVITNIDKVNQLIIDMTKETED